VAAHGSSPSERAHVQRLLRMLATAGVALMFVVIVSSAYLRLTQAGLSCADWPNCYGRAQGDVTATGVRGARFLHRVAASTVGIVLLGALLIGVTQRPRLKAQTLMAALALIIALLLAALGSQFSASGSGIPTPGVMLANLGGGFALFALLWWLRSTTSAPPAVRNEIPPWVKLVAALALLASIAQIALGGLVSAKFAALACPSFPGCGAEWPQGALIEALDPSRSPVSGAGDGMAPGSALAALHWAHRVGALIAFGLGAAIVPSLMRSYGDGRRISSILALLLIVELVLGSAAVLSSFPLGLAVAHNAVAAMLLVALMTANRALNANGATP
jgi:cytochrome c oxidase assembly protein subunit 15